MEAIDLSQIKKQLDALQRWMKKQGLVKVQLERKPKKGPRAKQK
jgi:hypothetical protein